MAQFKFRNYDLELDIEGIIFHVDCRSKTGDKIKQISQGGMKLLEDLISKRKTEDDAIKYCLAAIDGILGNGASGKIFATQAPTVTDCSDLLMFLCQEIGAKYDIQREKFIPKK